MKIKRIFLGLALFVIVLSCIGLFISRPLVQYAYATVCVHCEYDEEKGFKCVVSEDPGGTFCMAIGHDSCEIRHGCVPI